MFHLRRDVLALAAGVGPPLAGAVAIQLTRLGAAAGQGLLLAAALAGAIDGRPVGGLIAPLVGVAALVLLAAALRWAGDVNAQHVGNVVKERLRTRLYEQLAELGPLALTSRRTGLLEHLFVDGVESLETYFGRYLPTAAVCAVGAPALVALLSTVDVPLALVLLSAIAFLVLAPRAWARRVAREGAARWAAKAALQADYVDTLQGMTTIASLGAVASRREATATAARRFSTATMRQLRVGLFDTCLEDVGLRAGAAAVAAVAAFRLASGTVEAPVALLFLLLAPVCLRPFAELSAHWHHGHAGLDAAADATAFLRSPAPVAAPLPGAAPPPAGLSPRLVVEDVSFAHPGRDRPALDGVTFTVEPGETVAVVGPSGAGKTTLLALLQRHADPQRGTITIGGRDLRELTLDTVRSTIAVVDQDTYLFRGTLADNIRLAVPAASSGEVAAVGRLAQLDPVAADLADGYDTAVGERGLTLSGGQRQRVAIARALLTGAPLLLLDEATASLDAENDRAIRRAIAAVSRERTVIVVAHRLSTVRDADRVLLLDEGRLVEEGEPGRLLALGGAYARLFASQGET